MLYNVLVGFVFAQLHYITKKAASFLFLDAAFSFTAPFLRSYAKSWSLFYQAHLIKQFFHLFHEWFVVNLGVVSEYQLVELRRGQRLEFSVQESRVTLHRVSH